MRPASELNDQETLGKKILTFAQGFHTLIVPHPAVLADTVLKLAPLVRLSDKVLPLKSYFNMVQGLQRTTYLGRALALELTRDMPTATAELRAAREDRARQLEVQFRYQGVADLTESLRHVDDNNTSMAEDERIASWHRREERLTQESQRNLCTEDIFMLACAFVEVEIAKQGSVYYLKGEAPDFKETKKNRNPMDLSQETVLKTLAGGLARPDSQRGSVERSQIDSGFNHLVRLNALNNTMLDVVRWIKAKEKEGNPPTKVDIRKEFGLTYVDYERIMSMARRDGLIGYRNRKRDPNNRYILKQRLHERVVDAADAVGHTPQKELNRIIEDHFKLQDVRARQKELEVQGGKKSKAVGGQ